MDKVLNLVSVIIPVYNAEPFIEECLESVCAQSYSEIEVIAINDGSKDNSFEVCKTFATCHNKVRVINKKNTGVSDTRNVGIDAARGKYVVFVDSDDRIPPDAIEILVNTIEQSEDVGTVFGKHAYQYGEKILLRSTRIPKGMYETKKMNDMFWDDGTLSGILFGSVCGAIYRISTIRENSLMFDNEATINEDGLFNLRYFQCVQSVENIEETTYIYRQWKNRKSIDIKELYYKYKVVDEKIKIVLMECISEKSLKRQISTRNMFIIFQLSVLVCENNNFHVSKKELKRLWRGNVFQKNILSELKFENMNVYKRILARMMRNHHMLSFYLVIHYVYPCLKRVIRR